MLSAGVLARAGAVSSEVAEQPWPSFVWIEIYGSSNARPRRIASTSRRDRLAFLRRDLEVIDGPHHPALPWTVTFSGMG